MNRALFLDRDGVINVNHGYVHTRENFDFIDGIFDICRLAKQRGYLLIVATNQAGIGRGYYTEQDFHDLTAWMLQQFSSHGAEITKVYFCAEHPEYGVGRYKCDSIFRKPSPGMILAAANEFCIDLDKSVFVGDNISDIDAGKAAGIGVNILYNPLSLFLLHTTQINHILQLNNWL